MVLKSHGHARAEPSGDTIPSQTFCTSAFDVGRRFEIWREHFRSIGEIILLPGKENAFEARNKAWDLCGAMLHTSAAPARRFIRTEKECARSGVDHWQIRVLRSGFALSTQSDTPIARRPGQLVVGTYARGCHHKWTDGEWVELVLPRAVLSDWDLDLSNLESLAIEGENAATFADFLLFLPQRLENMPRSELPLLKTELHALLEACIAESFDKERRGNALRSLGKRRAIERIMRREISSACLNVDRISKLSGVSRAGLYRMFENEGGIAAFVQLLRLRTIRNALADQSTRHLCIADVAAKYGCFSAASFSRSFSQAFNETPRHYRRRKLRDRSDHSVIDFGASLKSLSSG